MEEVRCQRETLLKSSHLVNHPALARGAVLELLLAKAGIADN